MPRVLVLGKGARIAGGIICLLLALLTWLWVLRDIVELDLATMWDAWIGKFNLPSAGEQLTAMPATTTDDVGLGLLQLAAAFAAFTRAWTAGGLLAAATSLTFAYRLPVIWHAGLHSESSPYYGLRGFADDPSLGTALASAVGSVILCVVLGIVLMSGLRPWTGQPAQARRPGPPAQPYGQPPQPYGPPMPGQPPHEQQVLLSPQPYEPPLPSESPQRPTGGQATTVAVFLGLTALFDIGWNIYFAYLSGGGGWFSLLTGEGTVFALFDVSSAWALLTLALVAGVGCVLAMTRGLSARGFSLGLAVSLLPQNLIFLGVAVDSGNLFHVHNAQGVLSNLDLLLTTAAAVTLTVLAMRPGVAAQPGAPGPVPGPVPVGAPPYGAPMPGPGGAQPYGAPMPGAPAQGAPGAAAPFGAPHGQPPQGHPQPYFPPQPGPGYGQGPAGPVPAGPGYAPAPAQLAGPPPAAPPQSAPAGAPPGTPQPPAGPPPGATAGPPTAGPPPASPPAMPPDAPPPPAGPPSGGGPGGPGGRDSSDRPDGPDDGKSTDTGGAFGPPPVY